MNLNYNGRSGTYKTNTLVIYEGESKLLEVYQPVKSKALRGFNYACSRITKLTTVKDLQEIKKLMFVGV